MGSVCPHGFCSESPRNIVEESHRLPGAPEAGSGREGSGRVHRSRAQAREGRPVNEAEAQFYEAAKAAGWSPTKRGWPDFFMERNGEVACVEVKSTQWRNLKPTQHRILRALTAYGVPCFKWTPDGGFVRIEAEA